MKQAVERGLVSRDELELCRHFQTDEYFRASVIGSKKFFQLRCNEYRSNWDVSVDKRSLIDPFGYEQIQKSCVDRILCNFFHNLGSQEPYATAIKNPHAHEGMESNSSSKE
jgi:hypothetical protein